MRASLPVLTLQLSVTWKSNVMHNITAVFVTLGYGITSLMPDVSMRTCGLIYNIRNIQ
jgi:hypothetical protein